MHSSAQAMHITIVACSIDDITSRLIPVGRSITRIIAADMSAALEHMLRQVAISGAIIESAHIVHACSQAEQASIHSCITVMFMPAIDMSFEWFCIICMVEFIITVLHTVSRRAPAGADAFPRQPTSRPTLALGREAVSRRCPQVLSPGDVGG